MVLWQASKERMRLPRFRRFRRSAVPRPAYTRSPFAISWSSVSGE